MTDQAKHLLEQVLQLPVLDRAALVQEVLESLSKDEAEVEQAWNEEAARRFERYRSGKDELGDWDDLRSQLWAMLDR